MFNSDFSASRGTAAGLPAVTHIAVSGSHRRSERWASSQTCSPWSRSASGSSDGRSSTWWRAAQVRKTVEVPGTGWTNRPNVEGTQWSSYRAEFLWALPALSGGSWYSISASECFYEKGNALNVFVRPWGYPPPTNTPFIFYMSDVYKDILKRCIPQYCKALGSRNHSFLGVTLDERSVFW